AGARAGVVEPFRSGGSGGGRVIVLARTSLTNNGAILADGVGADSDAVGGGGGGGIIILASPGSLTHAGSLEAHGGDGGHAEQIGSSGLAGGGGGGGGIIHLISPTISNTGSVDVDGGA